MKKSDQEVPEKSGSEEAEKPAYPAATLAFYGPDDQFANKAVAAIVLSEEDGQAAVVKKWYGQDRDVRTDPEMRKQIINFLQSENVQRVVMADRIIGCPHEEGVDYPRGGKCPLCPFWASRDRWTGQKIDE